MMPKYAHAAGKYAPKLRFSTNTVHRPISSSQTNATVCRYASGRLRGTASSDRPTNGNSVASDSAIRNTAVGESA
jgi:hypothetical protein